MLNFKKPYIWILLAVVAVLVVVALVLALTPPAKEAPQDTTSAETDPPLVEIPAELLNAYPAFFGLDTANGLTVYVAKAPEGQILCSLYPTEETAPDFSLVHIGLQADPATMKEILSYYTATVTVVDYTLSTYPVPFDQQELAQVKYELGLGEKPEEATEDTTDTPYTYILSWSDVSADGERALRYTYYPIGYQPEGAYTAVGIKSAQELAAFCTLANGYFSLNASQPGKDTFNAAVKAYDEAFFAENGLVIVYIPSASLSYTYTLADVTLEDGELYVAVTETQPEEAEAQEAGWFMAVTIPQETISQATLFTAGN